MTDNEQQNAQHTVELPGPVVAAGWLSAHLDDVVVVDVTTVPGGTPTGREVYESGHIPGAVHVDLAGAFSRTDTDLPFMALDSADFAVQAGTLGIGDGDTVVVYDQGPTLWAARLWWNLRLEGHDAVAVLDGGLPAWKQTGGLIAAGFENRAPAEFTARRRPELIASTPEVDAAAEDDRVVLVDALSPQEYAGTGHIPGAVNLPAMSGYPREEAEACGALDPGKRTITYCHGGITAALDALRLAQLGRDDVAVYDGSLAEWLAASPKNSRTL